MTDGANSRQRLPATHGILVAQAADFDARLVGGLVPARGYARIHGIQLSAEAARS
jgi:hypothetical protein